jgi:hypothetical protein
MGHTKIRSILTIVGNEKYKFIENMLTFKKDKIYISFKKWKKKWNEMKWNEEMNYKLCLIYLNDNSVKTYFIYL